jgi:uncharacterized protein (DUF983 family)
MSFQFHIHGLWILGTICLFLGALIAGNVEWVEGTTPFSFWISIVLAFILFLFGGVCWISAAANVKEELV